MISIIICSRTKDITPELRKNIKETIGVESEIIVIDNSNNDYSIFSAYNKGVSLSKYPYLCFVHEDVLFKTQNWGTNLVTHLENKTTGIIGVAGGVMMTKVPAPSWSAGKKNMHIVQHKRKKGKAVYIKEPEDFTGIAQSAVLLDGVFLGMRSNLFNTIKFDETLSGFHGYDIDICAQVTVAGYNNYVAYDILLEHFSEGNGNAQYYVNLMKIYKKWESYLPLFCSGIPDEIYLKTDKIQHINLGKIIRRLAQTGFRTNEIKNVANYYVDVLNTKEAKKALNFIHLKILFERVFNPHKK